MDCRIVCATNQDLAAKIKAGTFREELYYRLGVVTVKLPPLRDRPEDIPHLARFFLERFSRRYGKSLVATPPFYEALLRQTWPGNAWLPWGIEFAIAPTAESSTRRKCRPANGSRSCGERLMA